MSLKIYCPPGETSTWETQVNINGNPQTVTYAPQLHTNGRYIIDVPRGFFTGVILRSNRGKLWEDENYEAMAWLGQNDHGVEVNDAFPGRDRPPQVAPAVLRRLPAEALLTTGTAENRGRRGRRSARRRHHKPRRANRVADF